MNDREEEEEEEEERLEIFQSVQLDGREAPNSEPVART
jgi:hypothetical protein